MFGIFSDKFWMSATGQKLDAIWAEFDKIAPNKAKCRSCQYECAPLVDRLKKHFSKVHSSELTSKYFKL